mgnify:CR=1 FL=1
MNAHPFRRSCLLALLFGGLAVAAGAQAARRLDQPLKIIQTVDPVFPEIPETRTALRGDVRVLINVDADGRLADCLVTSYTNRAFADAAVSALKAWRYEPARRNGEPIGVRAGVVFNFEVKGQVISFTGMDALTAQLDEIMGPSEINPLCRPEDLDRPVTAVRTVNPRIGTKDLRTPGSTRQVVVDFYVDQNGRPRMPVVVSGTADRQAEAVVAALMQWQYSVPRRGGEPVSVHASQTFVFDRNS